MDEKDLIFKSLTQGINIPLETVQKEICPECHYKSGMCTFMLALHQGKEDIKFVCKGMRHWVTENN